MPDNRSNIHRRALNHICFKGCESPGSIQDGSVTLSVDGILAFYNCDTGFSMTGTANITCQDDGTGWDLSPPTCGRTCPLTLSIGKL